MPALHTDGEEELHSQPLTSIGLAQMTCLLGDRAANLDKAESLLAALEGRAGIACLPEMFDLGYDLSAMGDDLFSLAEVVPGPTTDRLGRLAKSLGLAVVAGVTEKDPFVSDLLFDTTVVIDAEGELVGRYRKSHLYPSEHGYFRPGGELAVYTVNGISVGIATCFELAFPPIFTTLARKGAQLILNPSAVPVGFAYLQDLRTRARAQDNQVFVAAINHVGREGNANYCGGSQVADPSGNVIAKSSDTAEQVLVATLELEQIGDQRRQEPVFRGFRPELYEM